MLLGLRWPTIAAISLAFFTLALAEDRPGFVRFRIQEIDRSLTVGYAVLLVDINEDGRKDIVVVDTTRVIWFENPTWRQHTILQGRTKPDNVCIAAYDIDGDGHLDLALGAGWRGFNSRDPGTLQWLKRGRSPEEPWSLFPLPADPSLHRIRFADLDGDDRAELLVGPLLGRNASRSKNWMDHPLRLIALRIPKNPTQDRWTPEIIDDRLFVMHNFYAADVDGDGRTDVLTASYDGVHLHRRTRDGKWVRTHIGKGNQDNAGGRRGSSEIKLGHLGKDQKFIATIEPWHGHQVVVYTPPKAPRDGLWQRHVIDDQLRWGHAVWCADLDGDGDQEVIVGVRNNLDDRMRSGVRVYWALDRSASRWTRQMVDNGGIATEDLAAGDLNGDGRIDLVAVGRASHNVRIYWNEGR